MQRRHNFGPFADRGGDPLDRFRAHIADGEDAAPGRLQAVASGACLRSGDNEAL